MNPFSGEKSSAPDGICRLLGRYGSFEFRSMPHLAVRPSHEDPFDRSSPSLLRESGSSPDRPLFREKPDWNLGPRRNNSAPVPATWAAVPLRPPFSLFLTPPKVMRTSDLRATDTLETASRPILEAGGLVVRRRRALQGRSSATERRWGSRADGIDRLHIEERDGENRDGTNRDDDYSRDLLRPHTLHPNHDDWVEG